MTQSTSSNRNTAASEPPSNKTNHNCSASCTQPKTDDQPPSSKPSAESKTMIVVLDGSHVNGQLKRWLRGHTNWWFSTELCNVNFADLVAIKRNKICQYFLDHTEFEYLLMMDADMLPEEETDKIFEAPGDVVSCPYLGSNGKPSHFGFSNGSTGAGCLRISRRALRAIPKPWFKMEISDDGLQWQLCECGYFSEKAKHYGFNPIKCGRIGHKVPVLASLKQEDGKARAELRFGGSDGGYDHG